MSCEHTTKAAEFDTTSPSVAYLADRTPRSQTEKGAPARNERPTQTLVVKPRKNHKDSEKK